MPKGIYLRTPERIKELTDQIKGQKPPYTERMRQALLERNRGNKYALGLKRTQENKDKVRAARKGVPSPLKGTKKSTELRKKLSEAQKRRVAEGRNNLWRGGIYAKNKLIRSSLVYKLWREAVFQRDDFTCQHCRQRGGKLNADHIKSFSKHPKLRFKLSNGRTLCVPCHRKTDTWGKG